LCESLNEDLQAVRGRGKKSHKYALLLKISKIPYMKKVGNANKMFSSSDIRIVPIPSCLHLFEKGKFHHVHLPVGKHTPQFVIPNI
jgi:hypothetical protein